MYDDLKQLLVYDLETHVVGAKPDSEVDIIKYIGIRLPNGMKFCYTPNQKDMIQRLISSHRLIGGFNIKKRKVQGMDMGYDNRLMERYGFKFKTFTGQRSIFIDAMEIIEKRAKQMMYLDFPRNKRNLKYLAKFFKLKVQKGDFDYELLKKPFLTGKEYQDMKDYLFGDLDATYYLIEHLYKNFYGMKKHLSLQDQMNMSWLLSPSGTTGYKWFCNVMNKPQDYDDNAIKAPYRGALMWVNNKISFAKDVYVFDFASLYPNMMIGGNLFTFGDDWNGSDSIFEGNITGSFSKEIGEFEKQVIRMFLERKEIKKQMKDVEYKSDEWDRLDKQQLGIKILLNSSYGACFDEKTEVVTTKGIKNIKDLTYQDKVYSLNLKTDKTEIKPITKTYKYKHTGNMIKMKHRSYDFLITPNHSFYLNEYNTHTKKFYNTDEFLAQDLESVHHARFSKHRGMCLKSDKTDLDKYYLYGIYLSEGYAGKIKSSYSIILSQYKKVNPIVYNKIKRSLINVSLKFTERPKYFGVYRKQYYEEITNLFDRTDNKHISDEIFNNASKEQLESLLEGMFDGDGDKRDRGSKGRHRYTTKLECLKNDFVRLIVMLGYKFSVSQDSNVFRIYYRKSEGSFFKKSRNFDKIKFDDYVYCVEVEDNHTMLAGRNGKFEWTGNSGNALFKHIYDNRTASSITGMSRSCITDAKKTFESYGYKVIYQHTDSLYVIDHLDNGNRIKEIAEEITEKQRQNMNIYNEHHSFEFEKRIDKMWLIENGDGTNVKNRNVIISDGKVSYTGIKLKNLSTSRIGHEVFKRYITPELFELEGRLNFNPQQILDWIKEVVKDNPNWLEKRYRVKSIKYYSPKGNGIHKQISFKYGYGEHYLIANKAIGVGVTKKKAKLKELQATFGVKWLEFVDYSSYINELLEFIAPEYRKDIRKVI